MEHVKRRWMVEEVPAHHRQHSGPEANEIDIVAHQHSALKAFTPAMKMKLPRHLIGVCCMLKAILDANGFVGIDKM